MANTEITYTLNGVEYIQPRQAPDFEIEATFDGDSIQPNITTDAFNFVNEANQAILDWHAELPTEGMPLDITINAQDEEGNPVSLILGFYLDFNQFEILSDVECEIGVIQRRSLANIDERSRGITMRLLEDQGFLTPDLVRKLPYIVEDRKTTLEFISIGFQLYQIIKQSIDEFFKIVNIVSDISSVGILVAIVNLAVTIVNLARLILRSKILFIEIEEAIFPTMKFHRGFSIANYLKAGFAKMGYEYIPEEFEEFGTPEFNPFQFVEKSFELLIRQTILCPSKYDEVGDPILAPVLKKQLINPGDGILKPQDFGYTFAELLELVHKLGYTKMVVQGKKVIIRPIASPAWLLDPNIYDFPSTLIEEALGFANGRKSFNYDEMYGRIYISYAKDDSDLFTLTNVNSSTSEFIIFPLEVNEEAHLVRQPANIVEIPYALAIRRPDENKSIFKRFFGNKDEYIKENKKLQKEYEKYGYTDEFGETKPPKISDNTYRNGSMMVEHDYFKLPKLVTLLPNDRLAKSAPIDADRLMSKYHAVKNFALGADFFKKITPQKIRFSPIRIPFVLTDFQKTIQSSVFNFGEEKAKFTTIKFKPYKDRATVEFYIMKNWNFNLDTKGIVDKAAIQNPFE